MILIFAHSMIDIELEYMYFLLIIAMMVNFDKFELKKCTIPKIFASILGIMYCVLFVATLAFESNNYKLAYTIIPFYTEALQEQLYLTTNEAEQYEIARKIYNLNKYVSGVYEAFSNQARNNKEYDIALECEKKRLSLNKYTMYNYITYTEFLSEALQYYYNSGNDAKVVEIMQEICNVEDVLSETIAKTNPLCYKTQHIPRLEMPKQLKEFIDEIRIRLNESL